MRYLLITIAGLAVSGPLMAATSAHEMLQTYLSRSQRGEAPVRISYDFTAEIAAFGRAQQSVLPVEVLRTGNDTVVTAFETPAVRVEMGTHSLCVHHDAGWQCAVVDADQFAENLRNRHMSLYPSTAMYLVEQLITRYPQRVMVSAAGTTRVADRACELFRVVVDAVALPHAAVQEYLYVDLQHPFPQQYLLGTTLHLCFDRENGEVLRYENEFVLDQARMVRDGILTADEAQQVNDQPTGTVRGGLLARRVE
ncbi:MAG: hypothetical protein HYV02_05585 [Deltaproteobacteria bacterium]|nr:hypothetical protein [Deltaproteobacteria bacterium]